MFDHVTFGASDDAASRAFFTRALAPACVDWTCEMQVMSVSALNGLVRGHMLRV
ncbi:hypothetical protein [Massilia niastensis]|uniref:hypothetical protein n=1 Tax=Massilia niastensis TaxID=544911 RepID=UPI000363166E|nr:hypothetical protein [Massilia niastensis]